MEDVLAHEGGKHGHRKRPDGHVLSRRRLAMAMLPVRRSSGRNLTVVNPTREFEDIDDRIGQLMNLAFGLAPSTWPKGPGSRSPTCPRPTTPTWATSTCAE